MTELEYYKKRSTELEQLLTELFEQMFNTSLKTVQKAYKLLDEPTPKWTNAEPDPKPEQAKEKPVPETTTASAAATLSEDLDKPIV